LWEMAQSSIALFVRGKLFAEPQKVARQWAIGVAATALVLIVVSMLGAPLLTAALAAGLVGGALQPYLFKDLRYR
jgi:hypothetical protein